MTEQCPNDNGKLYAVAGAKTQAWENVFLSEPVKRLQKDFAGYTLTPRDIKDFMEVRTNILHHLSWRRILTDFVMQRRCVRMKPLP